MKIEVESEALDTLKAMAQRLQSERAELIRVLFEVSNETRHPDYDWSIDLSKRVDALLAKCTAEPKVME